MARPARTTNENIDHVWDVLYRLHKTGRMSVDEIGRILGYSRKTVFRRLSEVRLRIEADSPPVARRSLDGVVLKPPVAYDPSRHARPPRPPWPPPRAAVPSPPRKNRWGMSYREPLEDRIRFGLAKLLESIGGNDNGR